jgi:hypothetical protein
VLRHIYNVFPKFDIGLGLALLLTGFIIQPLLQSGLPTAADYAIHLYRTMAYEQAWAPGVIVPRWTPHLAFGFGYPLFVFAPPLPYFLGLLFHLTGFTFETSLKLVTILSILLYGGGMYLLGRTLLASAAAGLVAAVAYAFAPFALREVLLYGGNVPQFLAIGLFPWTLWAMIRANRDAAWGWLVLSALFYAGILLSHLFHALVFSGVVALFSLFLLWSTASPPRFTLSRPGGQRRFSYLPLLTMPMGLLFSAFSWLPAFFERYATRAQAELYLLKSPFFVRYPHWSELLAWIQPLDSRAANPYVPLSLGPLTLLLALAGLVAGGRMFGQVWRAQRRFLPAPATVALPLALLFFALLAGLAIFMTLPLSRPVWEIVTILQVAEFPWRMLGLANLGLAIVAGAGLRLLPEAWHKPGAALVISLQIVSVAPLLYPVTPFVHYGETSLANQIDYERRSQSVGTTTLGEYLPQTVTKPPRSSPLVDSFQQGHNPSRLDGASLPPGASATLLHQNATSHSYHLATPQAFTLRFLQFDYLGWQAYLNDQPLEIRPEAGSGLILLDIPPGHHRLDLYFGETPLRLGAILLTGLSLITVLGLSLLLSQSAPVDKASQSSQSLAQAPFPGTKRAALFLLLLIPVVAFGLKPLARPLFTVTSPAHRIVAAQQPADIRFAGGIRLVGYDLARRVAGPGAFLPVVLYWETDSAPLTVNLQPFVHLDRFGSWETLSDATNYTPGDVTTESNLPTFHWDNHRYVRDEHDLFIPAEAEPLAYALRVGLIDPDQNGRLWPLADGSGNTAYLTVINIRPDQPAPALPQPLAVTLSNAVDSVGLTGFKLTGLSPTHLEFKLAWQAETTPQRDYTVFAQLLDPDQNLVASFDSPPLAGAYPTSTWLAGQTIIDSRTIPVSGVKPGVYRLVVGLYDSLTQQRLHQAGGSDFVELTVVEIEE